MAGLLVKVAHRAAGHRRKRKRLQKPNLAVGIGEAGIGAEPVVETIVQVGRIGDGAHAEKFEVQRGAGAGSVIEFGEGGIAVDTGVMHRRIVDDAEAAGGENAEAEIAGHHRPLRIATHHHLAIFRRANAVEARRHLIQRKSARAQVVSQARVERPVFVAAINVAEPARIRSMVRFRTLE